MFKLEIKFSDDLESATIKFPEQIEASAEDLAELIRAFISIRSQMKPAVSMTPPQQTGVEDFTNNAPYWVSNDPLRGGATLRLRHAGIGWLVFWMPPDEASKLAGLLQEYGTPAAHDAKAN